MAFTLPSYVADPTLITGDIRLPSYVADPTLTVSGRLPSYVADPTATSVRAQFPAFVVDPTLAVTGKLPTYLAEGQPASTAGLFRYTQLLSKSAAGLVGSAGSMSKTPQLFVKTAAAASQVPKSLQNFTKAMTGESGVVATRSRMLEPFTKLARSDPFGAMARSTQYLTKTVTGVAGSVGTLSRSMEPPVTAKAGHVQVTGQTAKTLGLFHKSMLGVMGAGAGYITVSMHAEKQALTSYTNYPFNSFCIFGGEVYGASDAGLFKLTGANDNGIAIAATFTGGVSDFDDSHLKTIDRAYVGYRTDGDITFSLTQHDDGQTYSYRLPSNTAPGIFGRRVLTGRGLRARYYQWSISNVDGADFSIDTIELSARALSRRIGGKDA